MNKKRVFAMALVAAGLLASPWVFANHKHECNGGEKKMEWREHQDRMEYLKSQLKLTPDQETKFREAFQTMRDKIQTLREENRKTLASILTPKQRAKFDQMKEKMEKEHGHRPTG